LSTIDVLLITQYVLRSHHRPPSCTLHHQLGRTCLERGPKGVMRRTMMPKRARLFKFLIRPFCWTPSSCTSDTQLAPMNATSSLKYVAVSVKSPHPVVTISTGPRLTFQACSSRPNLVCYANDRAVSTSTMLPLSLMYLQRQTSGEESS